MTRKFRVGVVGAGYVSNHHLRALRDLEFVDVVGLCDIDESRARETAARHGVPAVYRSLEEMAAAVPEVIHVLTPPDSHCSLTLEALDMGCHVFIEKPMAETVAQCDQMIERARQKGLVLSVNHSARFDPAVLRAAQLARAGACGDILAVHFIRSSEYPPYTGGLLPLHYRQGSYPFRDLGVHGLCLLEMFLGRIERVQAAWRGTGRDPLLEFDEWRVDAEAAGGTGYMFLSWNARPLQNELWIHGTSGVIHVDCFLQACMLKRALPGPKPVGVLWNGAANAVQGLWNVPWNMLRFATGSLKPSPGIYRGVQDFYQALAADRPSPVSPEEGRHLIELLCQVAEPADRDSDRRRAEAAVESLEPARTLVTGGNGFLGSALVERLREKSEPVRLLLRRPPPVDSPANPSSPGGPVSIVYGSLGQPDVVDRAMRGVDLVYHVGAATKGATGDFKQGTVWGTRNVIESCLRHQVKRLVYVSSLSVLDHAGRRNGTPVTETSPVEPHPEWRGAYTQTKLEAEKMVLDAARARGLPVVIVRPGQIFGPGAERTTPNGVISIAGRWIVAGLGSRPLPLVYRDDAVDALLLAAESETAVGRIVNVVDPAAILQNEYLRRCTPSLGVIKVWKVPVFLLLAAGCAIEALGLLLKRSVPLSRYRIRSLRPLSPFDITTASALLGWKPRVGLEDGLRRTFGADTK
jgi:predicted dehydrogenase/nucleoside-diphosphate-sugar epimerase